MVFPFSVSKIRVAILKKQLDLEDHGQGPHYLTLTFETLKLLYETLFELTQWEKVNTLSQDK